jgi:hypothetical protein
LLQVFADDLKRRGVRFLMIAANNELDNAPYVRRKVDEIEAQGALEYVEVADYFVGMTNYGSPEGHRWGAKAHRILGEKLASVVDSESVASGDNFERTK